VPCLLWHDLSYSDEDEVMTHLYHALAASWFLCSVLHAQGTPDDWYYHGNDAASTKYSPLTEITAENFADLRII
ncbi:uncharacterized protein METZ01_LOCUS516459, partial [marine metagenome]